MPVSPQGHFPRNSLQRVAFPQAPLRWQPCAPHRGLIAGSGAVGHKREVWAGGEAPAKGHTVPCFSVFDWWMITRKSSRSLTVWLRILLTVSDGLVQPHRAPRKTLVLSHQLAPLGELQPLGRGSTPSPWLRLPTGKAARRSRPLMTDLGTPRCHAW